MTLEALVEAIARLIKIRRTANDSEQQRINKKLTKLYKIKHIALQQQNH